jgi:cystatin-related protein
MITSSFFCVCVQDDEKIPRLEFVKVLRAMKGGCAGSRFFITFEAKEEDSAGGQTKTYQTVVNKPFVRKPFRVLSFRECEVEQGNYDRIWILSSPYGLENIQFAAQIYLYKSKAKIKTHHLSIKKKNNVSKKKIKYRE